MANAESIVIHADHRQMVKFGSKSDEGYTKISDYLQMMTADADTVSLRWEQEGNIRAGTHA